MLHKNVTRLHKIINNSLFMTTGKLDRDRVLQAIVKTVKLISSSDEDTEFVWHIGESGHATVDSIIVGAYWWLADNHQGQNSREYEYLSAIGDIFQPNMSTLDEDTPENDVYIHLSAM